MLAPLAAAAVLPFGLKELDVRKADLWVYNARAVDGLVLDGLKILPPVRGEYLGVHHVLTGGRFVLRLVASRDLKKWEVVRDLDHHAHQGTIRRVGSEYLVAWEKDGTGPNFIRVAAFPSLRALKEGDPSHQVDLPTTLSPAAEGTPSIEFVEKKGDWALSRIGLRFHYYRDRDIDRQAEGVLTGFRDWKASRRDQDNSPLESSYRGNIGDRDTLRLPGETWDILEAQLRKEDWSSWRLLARRRPGGYTPVEAVTHGGSKSFANPTWDVMPLPCGSRALLVTLFLPSQGSAPGEAGCLIAGWRL